MLHNTHFRRALLCVSLLSSGMALGVSNTLLKITDQGFQLHEENGQVHQIHKYDVDPMIRQMNKKQLKAFLKHGYITTAKMSNGEHKVKAHARIKGGGWLLGTALGGLVRLVGYGTPVVAGGAALATGVGTVAGGIATAVGASTTTTAVVTTGATLGTKSAVYKAVGLGGAAKVVVATAATSKVAVATAVTATTTTVATTGTVATYVGWVEFLANSAQVLGTAVAWLP